jgi:hypothetical protein
MNPVMSELGIFVVEHEAWVNRQALRRARLVREARGPAGGDALLKRLANGLRQFIDPRGYAMSRLPQGEPLATTPVGTPIAMLSTPDAERAASAPKKAA